MSYNNRRFRRYNSLRLKGYDYTQPGAYFVTLCTKNRECLFGEVVGNVVQLNEYGCIVAETWQWLPQQYAYLELDAWVVMPNHLHGILIIVDLPEMQRKSLGRLVGAFKTVSARQINQLLRQVGQFGSEIFTIASIVAIALYKQSVNTLPTILPNGMKM